MKRFALWSLGLVLMLAIIGWIVSAVVIPRIASNSAKATEIWIETVKPGALTEIVSAPGEVEPRTKVEISARVSARITRLPFQEGDHVVADGPDGPSLLVELDASDIRAQLESSRKRRDGLVAQVEVEKKRISGLEASFAGVRTVLQDTIRELERQANLRETGDVSEKALETAQRAFDEANARFNAEAASLEAARLGLEVSRFNIEAAEADILRITEELNYTTMYSPIDGVVTRLNVDVGEIAITGTMNNPGTVLLEVADLSRMLVVARIDEANIRDVEPEQRAEIRLIAYPDQIFTGRVESVALAASREQGRYFETKVLLDKTEEIVRTGLSADVEVEVRHHDKVLLVPSQSVASRPVDDLPADIRRDNPMIDPERSTTIVVFRIKDNKVVATPVHIGASDSLNTLILGGLSEGDQIITGPFAALEALKHDQSIKITRRDGIEITPIDSGSQSTKAAKSDATAP